MALCHNCDTTRIEYTGNGFSTDYTFPFEYNQIEDVEVAFWDEDLLVWVPVNNSEWSFKNDTTLEFNEAPSNGQKLIIYRCTDLSPLPAEFFASSTIKAEDLNNNFFVLKSAIEETKCALNRLDEKAEEKYWNKVSYENNQGETVYSDERWVCTDETVPTTKAVCDYIDEDFTGKVVTESDVKDGRWIQNESEMDSDAKVASTASITERLDPYFQPSLPSDNPRWRMPGKLWFDNDSLDTKVWDQVNETWVSSGITGPPGPPGAKGTAAVIVGDTAPTRRLDFTPLVNGDIWFNSNFAELYVWYDDGNPSNERGKQWVQAVGGAKGEPGDEGEQGTPGPAGPPQNVIVSETAPTENENGEPITEGDLWWNSDDGNLYIYYVDNNGPQWVSCTKSALGDGSGSTLGFNIPLYEINNVVNFDVNLLQALP